MATVTAISTKGGGGGKKSLDYICRDDKTEGKKYVTALNCSLSTAYQEFKNTSEVYGQTDSLTADNFQQLLDEHKKLTELIDQQLREAH